MTVTPMNDASPSLRLPTSFSGSPHPTVESCRDPLAIPPRVIPHGKYLTLTVARLPYNPVDLGDLRKLKTCM